MNADPQHRGETPRQPLEDRVALVTGGGTGIGAGIARRLAAVGASVAVCGRRSEPLNATVARIEALEGTGLAVSGDVSNVDDVARIIGAVEDRFGGLDILINNAGIGGSGPIHAHDVETWDRVIAVNLRGPFLMSRGVLPGMRERKSGHIVNVSSEAGIEYFPGNGAYGVSKHALNALGEIMQRENQEHGIRVDTVCPGMVVTEMSRKSPGLNHDKCLYPDDIADLVAWLVTRRPNVKIGRPVLIQTMQNPWE